MAVASQSSDKTSQPTTTEPSDAASETSDRNDSVTSSPNLARDIDLQSQTALRSEEYRQLFRLPPDEVLIQDFNCACQESILLQGHMYMFIHYICFYSNIFGFETKKIIPFHEVTCVRKAKTAGIFPNAIEILAGETKYFFASFLSRDEAFKLINDGLSQHRNSVRAMIDEQEFKYVSGSNEITEVENVYGSKCSDNDFDLVERIKDTPIPEGSKMLPVGEGAIMLEALAEVQENVNGNAGADSDSLASSYSKKISWRQEDSDAPKRPEGYAKVAESQFPIEVEEFFDLFVSDDAANFFGSYHKRCGDKDLSCTSWCPHDEFGYARNVSFRHPIKLYFGAKFGSCQEAQRFKVYRNSHLVLETSQEISDAPYGDYFRVEGLWNVEKDGKSGEGCVLRVYVNVAFSKKTMFRGKIEQATAEECREAFAAWIDLAHEVLKQRRPVKQEAAVLYKSNNDPVANTAQSGPTDVELQGNSEGLVEGSQETGDQIRGHQAESDLNDTHRSIDTSVRGNAVSGTELVSFLREYFVRMCSSLRGQSQLSILLVVAFALVLLLMQLSIVVLLSRPQQVHVISQAEYLSGIGSGVTAGRDADSVAWLKRQINHLKEEMLMVEARLDKMRYEHSLLKAQIKELEQLRRQRI